MQCSARARDPLAGCKGEEAGLKAGEEDEVLRSS